MSMDSVSIEVRFLMIESIIIVPNMSQKKKEDKRRKKRISCKLLYLSAIITSKIPHRFSLSKGCKNITINLIVL